MTTWPVDRIFKSGDEFVAYLKEYWDDYITKHISSYDFHHTYRPNHSNYPKYTTLQLHRNMRHYHMNTRGWSDIGQHVSNGLPGDIACGLPITSMPASAYGHNGSPGWHPFMIENIGNFDKGHDTLEGDQLQTSVAIGHYLCIEKGKAFRFHREMDDGKSCPGTGLNKSQLYEMFKKYEPGKKVYTPAPPKTKSETVTKEQQGSYTGRRVESIYKGKDGLSFRNKPTWDSDDVVGTLQYGWGFPEIISKLKVGGGYQYKVKNSKGATYYVTAAPEYVKVVGESKKLPDKDAPRAPKMGSAIVPYPGHYIMLESPYMKGVDVERIQRAVGAHPDGIFGPNTERLVKSYQKRLGLTADGIVGPETWNMMF